MAQRKPSATIGTANYQEEMSQTLLEVKFAIWCLQIQIREPFQNHFPFSSFFFSFLKQLCAPIGHSRSRRPHPLRSQLTEGGKTKLKIVISHTRVIEDCFSSLLLDVNF